MMMITLILIIHIAVVIAMTGLILLQRSEGGGLGMGGSAGGLMTARGTANFLSKTTAIFAVTFFATSITLALLTKGETSRKRSILNVEAQVPISFPLVDREIQSAAGEERQREETSNVSSP
jgi:preprotein translocase subunit SecG